MAGREKALGVDHPGSLSTVNNMANIFNAQGQYEWALAGREKSICTNHPSTHVTTRCLIDLHERSDQAGRLRARLTAPNGPGVPNQTTSAQSRWLQPAGLLRLALVTSPFIAFVTFVFSRSLFGLFRTLSGTTELFETLFEANFFWVISQANNLLKKSFVRTG